MEQVTLFVGALALLGSTLIGGVFFAFSSFVMAALARLPATQGIAAMQSINVVVLNVSFLGAFFGTAVVSLGAGGLALASWDRPGAPFLLAGAVCYLLGTFLVTAFGNVPLNNRLATSSAADPSAEEVWQHYVSRWTALNHARTVAAMGAGLLFILGLTAH